MRISIEEKHSLVARYQAGESVSDICADSGWRKSVPRFRPQGSLHIVGR